MALIQCPECNNQISDSAKACPHCGYVLKKNDAITTGEAIKDAHNSRSIGKILSRISVFFLTVALVMGMIFNHVKQNNEQENQIESSEVIEADINEVNNTNQTHTQAITENTPYVDLGLPSGTKWKNANESGYYTHHEAIVKFGNKLPSKAQCEELTNNCNWIFADKGVKIIGPNGNSIFLPAAGYRFGSEVGEKETSGVYWSSTCSNEYYAAAWGFGDNHFGVNDGDRRLGLPVRLVKY